MKIFKNVTLDSGLWPLLRIVTHFMLTLFLLCNHNHVEISEISIFLGCVVNSNHHSTETNWKEIWYLRDDGVHHQPGAVLPPLNHSSHCGCSRCPPRAGSSRWSPPPWRRTTPRRRSSPAWTSSVPSSRSFSRSATCSHPTRTAPLRNSSSPSHTTPHHTLKQPAW